MNPLDYFSPKTSQDIPYPLSLQSLPQSTYQVSKTRLDYGNQSETNRAKNSSSYDSLAEPNKRIRLSHQSFTKVPSIMREIPHSRQSVEKTNFARNQLDLTCKDNLSSIFADIFRQMTPPNDEALIIPSLNSISQDNSQKFSFPVYQRMLQELEQRKTQFYVQQQFIMHFAKQQLHSQLEAQQLNQIRKNNSHEAKSGHTAGMSEAKKDSEDEENDFEYIQIEPSTDVDQKESDNEINHKSGTTKGQVSLKKEKCEKPRRNKNEQYWSEYARMLGNNIYKTPKEESRHKNIWQCKKSVDVVNTSIQDNTETNNLDLPQEDKKVKKSTKVAQAPKQSKSKPVDVPQHMQDDSLIDYENLISMTITNDPAYTGTESSTTDFVLVTKNANPLCVQPHDTRVGDRYQVSVPEYKGRVPGKRRNLKTIWRPEIVKESELKVYFDELCKIFSCERINQQEALRLLKSKKYRKEGVVGNIGKNRKYYAQILMTPNSH